tara:strand:+ start:1096 stop:3015 length:1920 start_codon:yes stop_codon:yes gene_type:complete
MTINSNKKTGFIIPTDDVELGLSGSATATSELYVSGIADPSAPDVVSGSAGFELSADNVVSGSAGSLIVEPSVDAASGTAASELSVSVSGTAASELSADATVSGSGTAADFELSATGLELSADDVVSGSAGLELSADDSGSAGSLIVDPSVDATVSVISAASAEQTYINTSGSINNVSFGFQAGFTIDSAAVLELNNYNTSNGSAVELYVSGSAGSELSGDGWELSLSGTDATVSGSADDVILYFSDSTDDVISISGSTDDVISISGSGSAPAPSYSADDFGSADDFELGLSGIVAPTISGSAPAPSYSAADFVFSASEASSLLGDNKINKLISFGKNPREQQKKSENNQGFHQTAFGKNTLSRSSGNSNTAFGTESGISITTGKRNTLIGNSTDISKEDGLAQLVIGYGAKGHANYTAVLGGSNNNEKSYEQTALKEIIPSIDNYTNLGSSDYRYKELFVNKLNNGVEYTLPTQSDISDGDFLDSDDNGQLSLTTLDKFKGLYVQRTDTSKSNQTITSISGVASITVSDIIKSQGRIYLDANTTSIVFTSSAKKFIKELGLIKDYDFTFNLYIYTKASSDLVSIDVDSKVTVSDTSNITLTYFWTEIYSTENNQFSNNSTRLVIRRLTSSTIEIEFTK